MSNYCNVLRSTILELGGGDQAKAELIEVKETGVEEIRFSWWSKDGKQFNLRPLDLPEEQWIELFELAVENDVISQEFIKSMIKVLSQGLK